MWSLKYLVGNLLIYCTPCARNCFLFHSLPRQNQCRLDLQPRKKKRRFLHEAQNVSSFLQFELQWMLIHCDPKRAQRESCNELPATEVQSGKGLSVCGGWCSIHVFILKFGVTEFPHQTKKQQKTRHDGRRSLTNTLSVRLSGSVTKAA